KGPRYEELDEQRRRVERAAAWRDLARQDLARLEQALREDLVRLDKQVAQHTAELDQAREGQERLRELGSRTAAAGDELRDAQTRCQMWAAGVDQSVGEGGGRRARGVLEAEAELARREKELADARAALRLLAAGSRPEEVEAEQARLARLQEEVRHLEEHSR